jgi:hypothetical protein
VLRTETGVIMSAGKGPAYRLWQWWKRVAHRIGDFQARLLLTVCYFVVIAPFALAVRSMTDPLAIKPGTPKGWRARPADARSAMARALQQF